LLWAERIKYRSKLLQLSQGDIFYAAQKLDFKGTTAYRLNATDQFVYLSLHCLKHYVQRLIWLVDLVSLSQNWTGKDWFALQQRAGELGQTRTVQYILYLLENLAAYRPTKVSDLFQEPPLKAWEKAILDIRKGKGRLPAWAPVALLPASLTPARRARFVFENIFPDPPVLREVFSSRSDLKNWQLYGLRALQLMGAKKPD
jgi:hypothetical protein